MILMNDACHGMGHVIPSHESVDAKGSAEWLYAHVFSKHDMPRRASLVGVHKYSLENYHANTC